MVPFAGYNMPVSYEGVTIEHLNVRDSLDFGPADAVAVRKRFVELF